MYSKPRSEERLAAAGSLSRQCAFCSWQLEHLLLGSDWVGGRAVSRWLATVEGVTVVDVQSLVEKLFNLRSFTTRLGPTGDVSGGGSR